MTFSAIIEKNSFDGGETFNLFIGLKDFMSASREKIGRLNLNQAMKLSACDGVDWAPGSEPLTMSTGLSSPGTPTLCISPRSDAVYKEPLWQIDIKDGDVDGDKFIGNIDDEVVKALMDSDLPIEFPDGEPDWKLHEKVHLVLKRDNLQAQLDQVNKELNDTPDAAPGM